MRDRRGRNQLWESGRSCQIVWKLDQTRPLAAVDTHVHMQRAQQDVMDVRKDKTHCLRLEAGARALYNDDQEMVMTSGLVSIYKKHSSCEVCTYQGGMQ